MILIIIISITAVVSCRERTVESVDIYHALRIERNVTQQRRTYPRIFILGTASIDGGCFGELGQDSADPQRTCSGVSVRNKTRGDSSGEIDGTKQCKKPSQKERPTR